MMRKGENGKKRTPVRGGLAKPGKYDAWAKGGFGWGDDEGDRVVCRETEREREDVNQRETEWVRGFETTRERERQNGREKGRGDINVPLNEREKGKDWRFSVACNSSTGVVRLWVWWVKLSFLTYFIST
jgi:hypothetical protein